MIEKATNDRYRPQYHFSPAQGWMNDPNGLVYFEGEYHLFYQHNPESTVWGPMHWGHAVSKDLMHWEHLPIALYPDEHGTIFSGSAVVDWQDSSGFFDGKAGLVAVFTHDGTDPQTKKRRQCQSLAYSQDRGRTWTKYAGNPVLCDENEPDFRDPKVMWHKPSGKWIMVLAVWDRVNFYGSQDLKNWNFLSSFSGGSKAGVWECPDLFPLPVQTESGKAEGEKWVLQVDINPGSIAGGSGGQYFVGHFDGSAFFPEPGQPSPQWIDYGKDNYAGVSWSDIPDEDGRRLWLGWMSNWQYANQTPTEGWRNAMTIPRELTLVKKDGYFSLRQRPVSEVLQRRGTPVVQTATSLVPETQTQISQVPARAEIRLRLRLGSDRRCVLSFHDSQNPDEHLSLIYDAWDKQLRIDRSRLGQANFHPAFGGIRQAPLALEDGLLDLHIFLDSCSIEVFAQDGILSMTELIFPTGDGYDLTIAMVGNTGQLVEYTHWPL